MTVQTGKTPTIGVLAGIQMYYGTILGNFIGPLLHGVYSAAQKRGCNLLLAGGMDGSSYTLAHPAWPVASSDVDFIPVGPWNTDGLIVFNPLFAEKRSRYIQSVIGDGHPVIFVAMGEPGPTVAIDNVGAIQQALWHLMEHGHRNIAFIAGYPNDLTGDGGIRLKTFQQFVQEHDLSNDPKLIAYGSHGINGGRQAMQQILESRVPFTAVLASNDESAIGAMEILKNAGLRIPQDVAVIGIDDTFEAMTQVPPLTTFHSSPFRMGYQALESLLDYIEGKCPRLEDTTVPMQFVIRQSCGCQPNRTSRVRAHELDAPSGQDSLSIVTKQLAEDMAETALAGTQRLSTEEVHARCRYLMRTFMQSLDEESPAAFRTALEEILLRAEDLEDDIYVWVAVLARLDGSADFLRERMGLSSTDHQVQDILSDARATLTQHMERYHRHLMIHQKWIADQVGHLNSRLLTALDESQIYEILADYLPQVGIRHMEVVFFEAEGDDLVAWCNLRKVLERDVQVRFPSRQFPPTSLYDTPYQLILMPMAGQDAPPGFIAFDAGDMEICAHIVWQLVTFLKVVRLYREATHGRQLAEEANRLKSRFLSTVSHELRTPLNLIVGLSEMLMQKNKDDRSESGRDVRRLHASAQHLDGLIRDVLDLAQNDVGELKLVSTSLDLADVLHVVAAAGEQLVQDKGLEWQASIPENLPSVWGDRTRIRQVTLNLINNAVKFTTHGRVTLQVKMENGEIVVEVSDTGLGILPEEQAVIFDEFRQSERTTELGYGGLGLGLAICKRLVELHGGRIGVRSAGVDGSGSTFYFTIPVLKSELALNFPAPLPHDRPVLIFAEPSGTSGRIQQHLLQQGFAVQMAWFNEAGFPPPHFLDLPPGAVILEEGPSLERSWEAIQSLRENPNTRDVPILVFALNTEQDQGSVLELNYITKPLNHTELIKALERQVAAKRKEGHTILIVDDEPSTVALHSRMVSAWSPTSRILTAGNGKEALEMIYDAHPDLVLLDLILPGVDGFGVLHAMRANPHSRDIPVIVLTGQTLTAEDMSNFGRGVTNVLKKGLFSTAETISHIEAALLRHSALGSEARRAVRKTMAYIHGHYMEPISLEDAARHVNMSREYLSRCFRQEMEITFITYLNRYRIARARSLLENGEQSLTEIALETGFSSSAYFSRIFRQEVGVNPREYQRSRKKLTTI